MTFLSVIFMGQRKTPQFPVAFFVLYEFFAGRFTAAQSPACLYESINCLTEVGPDFSEPCIFFFQLRL